MRYRKGDEREETHLPLSFPGLKKIFFLLPSSLPPQPTELAAQKKEKGRKAVASSHLTLKLQKFADDDEDEERDMMHRRKREREREKGLSLCVFPSATLRRDSSSRPSLFSENRPVEKVPFFPVLFDSLQA